MVKSEKETDCVCGWDEEVFFLLGDEGILHFLPGEEIACASNAEYRPIQFKRKQKIWIPIGTGNIQDHRGISWGGYCTVLCSLVSPRRFVMKYRESLDRGDLPDFLLAEALRQMLTETMQEIIHQTAPENADDTERLLWKKLGEVIKTNLLSIGLKMEEIKPGIVCRQKRGA